MDRNRETVQTREAPVEPGAARDGRVSGRTIAVRIVWFIVGFIVVLLALRMALMLLAANEESPFVDFVYSLSSIFAMPFYGIFSYTPAYGNSFFEISSLVAIVVYTLIGWGVAKALTITSAQPE